MSPQSGCPLIQPSVSCSLARRRGDSPTIGTHAEDLKFRIDQLGSIESCTIASAKFSNRRGREGLTKLIHLLDLTPRNPLREIIVILNPELLPLRQTRPTFEVFERLVALIPELTRSDGADAVDSTEGLDGRVLLRGELDASMRPCLDDFDDLGVGWVSEV
jgi:hypothetical protein